jgi:PPK2 family polyphosphate:nucleotide phosphotransferase
MAKTKGPAAHFRVDHGKKFSLSDFDPADTDGIDSKEDVEDLLHKDLNRLSELQEKLYAQDQWAVLVILQAMDAAGKDSLVKHVMSGVNPTGCEVSSFKAPSAEELDHDYLWRTVGRLPERGKIGIFNRSYYEEVLVVRVHSELLDNERIPPSLLKKDIWQQRFDDICSFERYLGHNGVIVRKFFLHVSKKEQKKRFLARLNDPSKNWKFAAGDIKERERWDEYMKAYEEMIQGTATPDAPWYVVPADNKWFTQYVVASALIDTLEELKLDFPKLPKARRTELESARRYLKRQS